MSVEGVSVDGVVGSVVGLWGVGGRVEFSQQGASKALNRVSSPPLHTSPATLRYLQKCMVDTRSTMAPRN